MLTIAAALFLACVDVRVVDGDTLKCDGQNLRLIGSGVPYVSGVDTAEMRGKCARERYLARKAKARLEQILASQPFSIETTGASDSSGRPLVRVRLADGRLAETILLSESLAVTWHKGIRYDWCSR